MNDRIRIIANVPDRAIREELEVPAGITANDLIMAFGRMYGLEIDEDNVFQYYLKADSPKALLRGNKTLREYGVRNGTEIRSWNS